MVSRLLVSEAVTKHQFRPAVLVAPLLVGLSIRFIVRVWRRGSGTATTAQVTGLSPKLLAIMLAVSLIVGLVTGGMAGSLLAT